MYCSKCGVQNSDGSTYCANCGSVLIETSQTTGSQSTPTVALAEPRISKLAMASVILGSLTVFCVTWPIFALPAIVCGVLALVKINKNKGQLTGTFLAVAGILVPVIMTFFVLLASAIALPAFFRAKMASQKTVCKTNLRQLIVGMDKYMTENDAYP